LPQTRRTYATVYRSFAAFLGPHARPDDLTPAAVRAYRDALEHAGRSPAGVAKHPVRAAASPTRSAPTPR
jgi:hypothetical protein